ncbi:unnamed protein product, partial [Candidula unifasciata]
MGNKCCKSEKIKEKPENPSLKLIREAQLKYYNSHIESDSDEDDDKDESTDEGLSGSEGSQQSLDNAAMETSLMADCESALQSTFDINVEDMSSCVLRSYRINNNDNIESQLDGDAITSCSTGDGAGSKPAGDKGKHYVKRRHNAKYIRLSNSRDFYSIFNTEDKKARSVDPKMYQYPFENIVFEGGGNKGLAYCGAVK